MEYLIPNLLDRCLSAQTYEEHGQSGAKRGRADY
jgi:hypothetical protein